jgi:3-hydroxyacyl-[acyl-carrier-protein] dehydratase
MPPPLLIDPMTVDTGKVHLSREQVYDIMPHRHEFMLLSGVCHYDADQLTLVSYSDIASDDWWVRGHVPGRPLLPGVLMLEMAAQTAAVLVKLLTGDREAFVGFGGVDGCKFRDAVIPPAKLYLCCKLTEHRSRRFLAETQGVVNGRLAFEARITGLKM